MNKLPWSFYGFGPAVLQERPISFYRDESFYLDPLPTWICEFTVGMDDQDVRLMAEAAGNC